MFKSMPPVPPPPPPPMHSILNKSSCPGPGEVFILQNISEQELLSDLQNQILRTIKTDASEFIAVNTFAQPILQSGPICGLVALGIAAQKLKPNCHPDFIFETAKLKGFTKNGEMFSIRNMESLACEILQCSTKIVSTLSECEIDELVMCLIKGGFVLIPYDALPNHYPGLRKGHSAHWGILTGILIPNILDPSPGSGCDESNVRVFKPDQLDSQQINIIGSHPDKIKSTFVIGLQGKSKHLAIWSLKELIQSNQNLIEISPSIESKPDEFVIYPMKSSMCDLALLLNQS